MLLSPNLGLFLYSRHFWFLVSVHARGWEQPKMGILGKFLSLETFSTYCRIAFGIFAYIKILIMGPAYIEVLSYSIQVVIYRKKIGVKYFNVPKRKRI